MSIKTDGSPEKWDMTVYVGDKWPAWSFVVVNEDNQPVNLTGASILMQVKAAAVDTVAIKTLTQADDFTIVGNKATFNTDVDVLPGQYLYDIQVTLANGNNHTLYFGKVTAKQDVSR